MPDGIQIPGGPSFAGFPQPPDVPCDPVGDGWRGPQGFPGPPGPPGPQGEAGGIAGAFGSSTFSRTDTGTVSSFPPVVTVNYNNKATGGVPSTFVAPALEVNAQSYPGNVGYTFGGLFQLTSGGTGILNNQDVALTAVVTKPGGALSVPFGIWVPVKDTSGLDGDNVSHASRGGIVGIEMDYFCNGPDNPPTSNDPQYGSRVFLHLGGAAFKPTAWAANTAYALNAAVQPSTTNGYTYVCTAPGTSGVTQPTWPTSAGTVTDGTVTWMWGTTMAPQIGRVIHINGHPGDNVTFGAALYATAAFYDAIIELSGSTLVDGGVNDAAIRIGANQPIDFSGDLTQPTQNNHTLRYINNDGGPHRLSYLGFTNVGTDHAELLTIADGGQVSIGLIVSAANDAAAAALNVPVHGLYRNGSQLMIRVA